MMDSNPLRTSKTSTGIAYQRDDSAGGTPVVLLHAGIADARMWDPIWDALAAEHDAMRLDLRGYGESARRPGGALDLVADVSDCLDEVGIGACDLVAASYGAGVAVGFALEHPERVRSLVLVAPGGELIADEDEQLAAFVAAEDEALGDGDLDSAAEVNVRWWVDTPHRDEHAVEPSVRDLVRRTQRRAFELTADWDDIEEHQAVPPVLDRLEEIDVPTLVLIGGSDMTAIQVATSVITERVRDARRVDWPEVGHLPSMERPEEFLDLLRNWLTDVDRTRS